MTDNEQQPIRINAADGTIIKYETLVAIRNSLKQSHKWIRHSAIYSHPKAHIRIVLAEIEKALQLLNDDIAEYRKLVEIGL